MARASGLDFFCRVHWQRYLFVRSNAAKKVEQKYRWWMYGHVYKHEEEEEHESF